MFLFKGGSQILIRKYKQLCLSIWVFRVHHFNIWIVDLPSSDNHPDEFAVKFFFDEQLCNVKYPSEVWWPFFHSVKTSDSFLISSSTMLQSAQDSIFSFVSLNTVRESSEYLNFHWSLELQKVPLFFRSLPSKHQYWSEMVKKKIMCWKLKVLRRKIEIDYFLNIHDHGWTWPFSNSLDQHIKQGSIEICVQTLLPLHKVYMLY